MSSYPTDIDVWKVSSQVFLTIDKQSVYEAGVYKGMVEGYKKGRFDNQSYEDGFEAGNEHGYKLAMEHMGMIAAQRQMEGPDGN